MRSRSLKAVAIGSGLLVLGFATLGLLPMSIRLVRRLRRPRPAAAPSRHLALPYHPGGPL